MFFPSHLAEHLNELIYRHRLRRLFSLRARMICFFYFSVYILRLHLPLPTSTPNYFTYY